VGCPKSKVVSKIKETKKKKKKKKTVLLHLFYVQILPLGPKTPDFRGVAEDLRAEEPSKATPQELGTRRGPGGPCTINEATKYAAATFICRRKRRQTKKKKKKGEREGERERKE
jgi:hypothetical protein